MVCILWYNVRTQECANSSTQTSIELDFIRHNSSSLRYMIFEVAVDLSMNQYIVYSNGTFDPVHVAKRNASGDYDWSMRYDGIDIISTAKILVLSSDENTLRILGDRSSNN